MFFRTRICALAVLAMLSGAPLSGAQQGLGFYTLGGVASGQNVAPAFEGWEENPDGTFNMVFGYFNRNWEEQPHVPIGPNNSIEPGGPDQGQPTLFFPRRNVLVFRIQVPKDFGNKELVWTLTVNGKTERAYATLKPDYKLDSRISQTMAHNLLGVRNYPEFDADMTANTPPVVAIEGDTLRSVRVGEPLSLSAKVSDDGRLKPRPVSARTFGSSSTALGLRVAWFVYRGPGDQVTFDPEQFKVWQNKAPGANSPFAPGWSPPKVPADGRFQVKATFATPGAYTLRILAHDGGLSAARDVVITVIPAATVHGGFLGSLTALFGIRHPSPNRGIVGYSARPLY